MGQLRANPSVKDVDVEQIIEIEKVIGDVRKKRAFFSLSLFAAAGAVFGQMVMWTFGMVRYGGFLALALLTPPLDVWMQGLDLLNRRTASMTYQSLGPLS